MSERNKLIKELSNPVVLERVSSPEKNLIAAIIMRAIRDYLAPSYDSENFYIEARAWLLIDRPVPKKGRLFSFVWCCNSLDLEPLTLRDIIQRESLKPREESEMVAIITDANTSVYNKGK